jgi:hypothetical protein
MESEKMPAGRKSRVEIMASDPKALTEAPEFKAAVSAAVSAEVSKILDTLKGSGSSLSSGDQKFAENLAMAFATLSEQGTGRKYVAPEILRTRAEARERMFDLIVKARKEKRAATYQVVAKTYLDNQMVEPLWVDSSHIAQPTEIDWPGVPNDAMKPMNDTAQEIHAAFLESVGSKAKIVLPAGGEADAPDPSQDGYGVTAKGLVVRGGAVPRQNREASPPVNEEGLAVLHKNQPGRSKEINVLGTIAAPARQNA